MTLPELLSGTVGDEDVVARVPLGGDDLLAVTPTRTLVYRADGLLSDESVEEYGHDAERIDLSTGRRKSKLVLGYGLDGDETLSLPTKRVDDVLHPVLAGVLSATGVTEPGESVRRTFRFSELTLVVTDRRLVKHVGSAVWDEEFEEFPYANLTDLDFEEGTVATAVVLTHDGRSERFKAPNDSARAVRETLVDAVCAFHGVDSLEEFRVTAAVDEDDGAETAGAAGSSTGTTDFGEGPDPLSASPAADAEARAEPNSEPDTGTASDGTERDDTMGDDPIGDDPVAEDSATTDAAASDASTTAASTTDASTTEPSAAGGSSGEESVASDPLADDFAADASAEAGTGPGSEAGPGPAETDALDETTGTEVDATDDPAEPDAFEGSPFESVGVEDDDLAAEVASLRAAVEAQSERLERQSELIERLIEELRRGR